MAERFDTSQSVIQSRAEDVYTSDDLALIAIRSAFLNEYGITTFDTMSTDDLDATATVFATILWNLADIT